MLEDPLPISVFLTLTTFTYNLLLYCAFAAYLVQVVLLFTLSTSIDSDYLLSLV